MQSILDAICDLINTALDDENTKVVVGALPSHEGVSIQQAGGGIEADYIPKTQVHRSNFAINSKYRVQETAIQKLDAISYGLVKRIAYPETEEYQITNIQVTGENSFLGQEENETYLYGMSIVVFWFDKRQAEDYPRG